MTAFNLNGIFIPFWIFLKMSEPSRNRWPVKHNMLKSVCVSVHIALVLPQVWRVENVARLLVLCGTTLCYSVLANKAHNGRLFEISKLLVYLILVRMSSLIQIKKDTFKASYLPQSHNIILLLCLSNQILCILAFTCQIFCLSFHSGNFLGWLLQCLCGPSLRCVKRMATAWAGWWRWFSRYARSSPLLRTSGPSSKA